MKSNYKWALWAAALVALIVVVDRAEDWLTHIEYPFNVWRMDLDDLLANLGLFLGGLAAFLTVIKRVKIAESKAEKAAGSINGKLASLAEEHVRLATQEAMEAGHYVELLSRITSLETERNKCLTELENLRTWIEGRMT